MSQLFRKIWQDDEGQDIAEYAVMLAVILIIVIGTIRLIGIRKRILSFPKRPVRFNELGRLAFVTLGSAPPLEHL